MICGPILLICAVQNSVPEIQPIQLLEVFMHSFDFVSYQNSVPFYQFIHIALPCQYQCPPPKLFLSCQV